MIIGVATAAGISREAMTYVRINKVHLANLTGPLTRDETFLLGQRTLACA